MPVTIENKTDCRVLLRFNSGLTRHLAPGEVLKDVERLEIKGNERIHRLAEQHVIAIQPPTAKKPGAATPLRSTEMRAEEAIAHIRDTPIEALRDFVPPDEDRVTVLRAMEEKRGE